MKVSIERIDLGLFKARKIGEPGYVFERGLPEFTGHISFPNGVTAELAGLLKEGELQALWALCDRIQERLQRELMDKRGIEITVETGGWTGKPEFSIFDEGNTYRRQK